MSNDIKDLSGIPTSHSPNPFDALINEANNDTQRIQNLYSSHRTNRNAQQSAKLLAPDFAGMTHDPIFSKTIDPANDALEVDHRHCLVFWARPPAAVRELVSVIQGKLKAVAPGTYTSGSSGLMFLPTAFGVAWVGSTNYCPNDAADIWLMPLDRLHMNVFEITHSRMEAEIDALESQLSSKVREIVNWTFDHRARLVKPLLGYDSSAVALTFVSAAGKERDAYGYHHLRRDIYDLCTSTGVPITSRYTVPSAHLTVARFVCQKDFVSGDGRIDSKKVRRWVEALEGMNEWLQNEYWASENPDRGEEEIKNGGEWIVGQEKGLDHRRGTLWYGGGETVMLGRGF